MKNVLGKRAGKVTYVDGMALMEFERRLDHPPQVVWDAITGPDQIQKWFLTRAKVDGKPGGSIEFWSGGGKLHVKGRILTWDPPRVFEHERIAAPGAWAPDGEDSVIRWELVADGEGTILRLVHRKLDSSLAIGVAPATHILLDRLEQGLDGGPMTDMSRFPPAIVALYRSGGR